MNKNLFQIANEMTQLIEYGCDEDGIIAQTQEEFNEMYDNIQLELTTKIDNTNGIIKMITSDIALADTEIKRLEALKKDAKKHISWMTDRIDYVLRQQNTNEDGVLNIEGLKEMTKELNKRLLRSSISYRKSESVEIIDADKIPKKYKTIVIEEKPNKTALKEYLNTLPKRENKYAKISTNMNINIK